MVRIYRTNQRTDQNVPTQLTENQNTQAQINESQKTQSLKIPTAKKPQVQITQGQDTQNWNNDTNWVNKSFLSLKNPKNNWKLYSYLFAILIRMLNIIASYKKFL